MVYEFGPFTLDARKRLLFRDGVAVSVTPKVLDTLNVLVERRGEVVDKDTLMSEVWPEAIVEESGIARNVSVLRKILGEVPEDHRYIVTVPGQGYKFVADVRIIDGTLERAAEASMPLLEGTPFRNGVDLESIRLEEPSAGSARQSWAFGTAMSTGLLVICAFGIAAYMLTDAWRPDNGERRRYLPFRRKGWHRQDHPGNQPRGGPASAAQRIGSPDGHRYPLRRRRDRPGPSAIAEYSRPRCFAGCSSGRRSRRCLAA